MHWLKFIKMSKWAIRRYQNGPLEVFNRLIKIPSKVRNGKKTHFNAEENETNVIFIDVYGKRFV